MKSIISILLIQFCGGLFSQILENTEGQTFGEKPNFVEDFVRRNKIKSIKGTFSTKAAMDYIRPNDDIYIYKFNQSGELTLEYKTQLGDTLVTIYLYDDRGNLTVLRKSDQYGFHSYHYKYDALNRIIYSEYRRDTNRGQDKLAFEPDQSLIVSTETFEYIELEGKNYKKIYYNNTGNIYKEEFFYFDENNYLIRQEGILKTGSGRTNTTYAYDEKGRLLEKYSESFVMGNYTSKYAYEYDEFGNILSLKYYRNGEYITEYQIMYYPETLLLLGIITRDHATNFMTILSFKEYVYFD